MEANTRENVKEGEVSLNTTAGRVREEHTGAIGCGHW
jgi:hypothetical protein